MQKWRSCPITLGVPFPRDPRRLNPGYSVHGGLCLCSHRLRAPWWQQQGPGCAQTPWGSGHSFQDILGLQTPQQTPGAARCTPGHGCFQPCLSAQALPPESRQPPASSWAPDVILIAGSRLFPSQLPSKLWKPRSDHVPRLETALGSHRPQSKVAVTTGPRCS